MLAPSEALRPDRPALQSLEEMELSGFCYRFLVLNDAYMFLLESVIAQVLRSR